jgi:hypothetical protein|tara:strand:+ start:1869 stop:2051 length:183 start_codon:yes stop_codon:yes gene_type:complete
MPSYNGKRVNPSTYTAGFAIKCGCTKPGDRTMKSNNTTIKPTLKIDSVEYKGNAVLNANK